VISWDAAKVAHASGARLLGESPGPDGPSRAVIDSREVLAGDLFVGLAGARDDGGLFAAQALEAGAWGVLVRPRHAHDLPAGVVLVAEDPLLALQSLAREWRRELGGRVIAITGSTGKTSTKDILAALLAPALATVASPHNHNTEIGVPLAILSAPGGTQALVLELAMRGAGQIAELAKICEPDVGVIVNVGPAHLELLGSLEAIAAAKAELLEALADGAVAVIPSDAPLLEAHLRDGLRVLRFGEHGDVRIVEVDEDGIVIDLAGERIELETGFRSPHLLIDLSAAVAAASAIGVPVSGTYEVAFSSLRGERVELAGGLIIINDCYNANPMSMRAALQELGSQPPAARRVAVLGDMLELGRRDEEQFHLDLGTQATDARVSLLITVGPLAELAGETFRHGEHLHAQDAEQAAELLDPQLQRGDVVLVKGSRGIGLEVVARRLALRRAGE
jgi:UDP-N-acetylmuramoyl-tripeptide--D-alanyl-D-alanine ligase